MGIMVAPSVLSSDFANLEQEVRMLNNSKADWIHIDVMDGVFVPNISFGLPVLEAIKKHAEKPLDVHLMIVEPEKYVERFIDSGADYLTVQLEACPHLHRTVQQIKEAGAKAGVAINPHTPVSMLENVIRELDMVLLMSVNPGFGGQKFIPNSIYKLKQLKELIEVTDSPALIEVDGGVNLEVGKELSDAGADVLVAGSFIFKSDDPAATIAGLKKV